MTERQLFKRLLLIFVIMQLVYIAVTAAIDNSSQDCFTDTITLYGEYTPGQLAIEFDDDSYARVIDMSEEPGLLHYTLQGLSAGRTYMFIKDLATDLLVDYAQISVAPTLLITNLTNGNFASCREHTLVLLLMVLGVVLLMLYGYTKSVQYLGYSYQSIFYIGFSVWLVFISIHVLIEYVNQADMITIYSVLQNAGIHFLTLSLPVLFVFCIALSISNISLIRHERFRMRNALGILLSAIILLGGFIGVFIYGMDYSGSEEGYRLRLLLLSIYTSFYCLMECFLLGSVICGMRAAFHEPAPDRDFIIILGCSIRKDGTLYPLLRGRVDRAITFYRQQIAAVGKAPVLVPSGGQGSDEVISEAEAMSRYLLEQGIPAEHIMKEDQSRNTRQNMMFSQKLIEERNPSAKVAFSTTNYHIFRSGIISRQISFFPDGMGSRTKWYFWPNAYVREMVGMMVYLKKRLILIGIVTVGFFVALHVLF